MAFQLLAPATRGGGGNSVSDDCRVACFTGTAYKAATQFSIPRSVLREAKIPDMPGSRVDVMIGTGADAGSIAIIPGARYSLSKVGNGLHRMAVVASGVGKAKFASTVCTRLVGNKQIILTLPADFPWAAITTDEPQQVAA